MSDIAELLRDHERVWDAGLVVRLRLQAADEIEQLRARNSSLESFVKMVSRLRNSSMGTAFDLPRVLSEADRLIAERTAVEQGETP